MASTSSPAPAISRRKAGSSCSAVGGWSATAAGAAPLRLSANRKNWRHDSSTDAVGLDSARKAAAENSPDVVICDYDVLASIPLRQWEHDVLLSTTPVIAVSLTRHAEELQLFEGNGIAGFLYLPTLEPVPALRILRAAAARPKYTLGSGASAPRTLEHS